MTDAAFSFSDAVVPEPGGADLRRRALEAVHRMILSHLPLGRRAEIGFWLAHQVALANAVQVALWTEREAAREFMGRFADGLGAWAEALEASSGERFAPPSGFAPDPRALEAARDVMQQHASEWAPRPQTWSVLGRAYVGAAITWSCSRISVQAGAWIAREALAAFDLVEPFERASQP